MAKITCEVKGCDYNCDGGCKLSSIKVEGFDATTSKETVCESYTDKNEKGAVNCIPCACATNSSEIKCDATNCKYNANSLCTADRVTISCDGDCCCDNTECKTFKKD